MNWKCVIKCEVFTVGFGNSLPRFKWLFQIVLILICVCIHTYFQAKLNSKSLDIAIHMSHPNSKSSTIVSDGSLTNILRPDFCFVKTILSTFDLKCNHEMRYMLIFFMIVCIQFFFSNMYYVSTIKYMINYSTQGASLTEQR